MPFLVWHSLLGSSSCVPPARCPQESPSWSAISQKCPPITSWPSISSTTCTEPEVSRTQVGSPPSALENSARKSLPPAPRYSAPLALATDIPHEGGAAAARQEASWLPSRSSLTSDLATLPSTASQAHAAQIVLPSSSRSW